MKSYSFITLSFLCSYQVFPSGYTFQTKPVDIFKAIERKDMDACKRFITQDGDVLQADKDGNTALHDICGKKSNFYESEGRRFFYLRPWIALLTSVSCIESIKILSEWRVIYDIFYRGYQNQDLNHNMLLNLNHSILLRQSQFFYVHACRIFLGLDSLYEREERRFFYINLSLMLLGLWYCDDMPLRNFLYVNLFGLLFSAGPLIVREDLRFFWLHMCEMVLGTYTSGDNFFYLNLIGMLCSFGSLLATEDRRFFNIHLAGMLIDHGANMEAQNKDGNTALHLASSQGNGPICELLLANGADIRCRNKDGSTALHIAAAASHLVSHMRYPYTPVLTWPWRSNRDYICKLLLEKSANIRDKNNDGSTALHIACRTAHQASRHSPPLFISPFWKGDNDFICKLLLEKGALIDAQDTTGSTGLHIVSELGNESIGKLLLKWGAQLETLDTHKRTALHVACLNGREAIGTLLLDNGANIEARERDGKTPFHLACQLGNKSFCELLLNKGANIEAKYEDGKTALHGACEKGDRAMCIFLLDKGALINAQTNSYTTPLMIACKEGHQDVVRLLLANKGLQKELRDDTLGGTALHWACYYNQIEICRELLRAGYNPSAKAKTLSLLHIAVKNGSPELVELFLDHQKDANLSDKNGETALHLACQLGRHEIIERLLAKKGPFQTNIDATSLVGKTPLHCAVESKNLRSVLLLLDSDAKPNETDSSRKTPLVYAAERKQLEVCRLLKDRISVTDFNKVRSFLISLVRGHQELEKLFSPYDNVPATHSNITEVIGREENLPSRGTQSSIAYEAMRSGREDEFDINIQDETIVDQVSDDESIDDQVNEEDI